MKMCPSCHRERQYTAHNSCLYCGAELPDELKYTQAEMDSMKAKSDHDKAMSEIRRAQVKPKNNDGSWSDGYFDPSF